MRILAILLATAALGGPAQGGEPSKAGPTDPRIRIVDYDPWGVVKVTGVFRTATEIMFGADETILHVALGDSDAWDIAAEGNILFVKPKVARGPTNLIVTTTRPGGARNYTFELIARAGGSSRAKAEPLFGLRFRYPVDALSAEAAALERRIVQLKLDRAVVEGQRNLAYAVQGASALQPSEVSDNGRFTVMRFPANQQIPAIYQVESTGSESLVAFDVRGEFVVIHAVAHELRLRRGREVLCIYNEAYAPYGVNFGTGTAAADVERTSKGAWLP